MELDKDDCDELFSLRITGRKRIWGIKDGNILWILGGIPIMKSAQVIRSILDVYIW